MDAVFVGELFTGQDLATFTFRVFRIVFAIIPIALFVAILRYHLWDVDRLVNRAMVYGALTGVLGLLYAVGALVVGLVPGALFDQRELVVVWILAAALLFRPIRRRLQAAIDRRFYREKLDTVAHARDLRGARARPGRPRSSSPTSSSPSCRTRCTRRRCRSGSATARARRPPTRRRGVRREVAVVALAARRRPRRRRRRRRGGRAPPRPFDVAEDDPLLLHLQQHPATVAVKDLDLESPALDAMRAAGIEVVVPLVSQGELIGVLNLGPRRSERPYSLDDRRLLDNLAGNAAAAIRVAHLVRHRAEQAQPASGSTRS